jgi:hypothetical protein
VRNGHWKEAFGKEGGIGLSTIFKVNILNIITTPIPDRKSCPVQLCRSFIL